MSQSPAVLLDDLRLEVVGLRKRRIAAPIEHLEKRSTAGAEYMVL
jgi:hypothetical protein